MILITGAAGFIGSNIVADLDEAGREQIAACDWFETGDKWQNLVKHRLAAVVPPEDVLQFLNRHAGSVKAVVHMGAISATTERNVDLLVARNITATLNLWDWCAARKVPFIYASSAATYGAREDGFDDDDRPEALRSLRPLNPYGWSKKATDDMIASRIASGAPAPPQWVGLKFFNVYGPNEYHKGDMRSVVSKMFDAAKAGESIRLFKSDRPGIEDGDQRRDFVYVKDCSRAVLAFLDHPEVSGLFNIGSGRAQSFLEMFHALESALGHALPLEFVDMPESLRGRYQYFTQANMTKFAMAGMSLKFLSVESGVADYVLQHLATGDPYR